MKNQKCKANGCKGTGTPSKALKNVLVGSEDFGGDAGQPGTTMSEGKDAKLIDCLKCNECGASWVPVL